MEVFCTFIDKNCLVLRKKDFFFNLKLEEITDGKKCAKSAVKPICFIFLSISFLGERICSCLQPIVYRSLGVVIWGN